MSRGKWFAVVATQNPIEQEGTYPLPEAQLDRFAVRIVFGYPRTLEDEIRVYKLGLSIPREPVEELEPVIDPHWLAYARLAVATSVDVPYSLVETAARLVRLTRPEASEPAARYFELGASPRAGLMLLRVARALAALRGAHSVEPVDLLEAVWPVLNHRLVPRLEAVVERGAGPLSRLEVVREGISKIAKSVLGVQPPI